MNIIQKLVTLMIQGVSQPHFGQNVKMRLTLTKMGTWESFGTPATLELDNRGQNTSL